MCSFGGITGNSLRVEQNGAKTWHAHLRQERVRGYKPAGKKVLESPSSYCGPHIRPEIQLKPTPTYHTSTSSKVQLSNHPQPAEETEVIAHRTKGHVGHSYCAHVHIPLELVPGQKAWPGP